MLDGKEHEFGDAFVVSLGGKLYDDFLGRHRRRFRRQGATRAFPADMTVSDTDSWRCVSCHGWDYDGADKASGSEQQSQTVHKFAPFAGV